MRLNEAIGANDCRLRGDGKLVDPGYFRTALALIAIVEAALARGGRQHAGRCELALSGRRTDISASLMRRHLIIWKFWTE